MRTSVCTTTRFSCRRQTDNDRRARKIKKIIAWIACLLTALAVTGNASACTAVYIGRKASMDGTVIIAKSNDHPDVWGNYAAVTERAENMPGRTMPVDNEATVFAEMPPTTYRYTSTPFMDCAVAVNGLGHDAAVCANELGVTMIMSIASFSNAAALSGVHGSNTV